MQISEIFCNFAAENEIEGMTIYFQDKKLEKYANDERLCIRKLGAKRAELYYDRLYQMQNAETLEDTRHLPGHYHDLVEDRKGQWSCDLDQPYRLIFEPTESPIPINESGGYDWKAIKIIDIVEIVNYHGK